MTCSPFFFLSLSLSFLSFPANCYLIYPFHLTLTDLVSLSLSLSLTCYQSWLAFFSSDSLHYLSNFGHIHHKQNTRQLAIAAEEKGKQSSISSQGERKEKHKALPNPSTLILYLLSRVTRPQLSSAQHHLLPTTMIFPPAFLDSSSWNDNNNNNHNQQQQQQQQQVIINFQSSSSSQLIPFLSFFLFLFRQEILFILFCARAQIKATKLWRYIY